MVNQRQTDDGMTKVGYGWTLKGFRGDGAQKARCVRGTELLEGDLNVMGRD